MNLKDIILKQISFDAYEDLNHSWYNKSPNSTDYSTLAIVKPLVFKSYEDIIYEFTDAKYAKRLAYYHEGWKRWSTYKIKSGEMTENVDMIVELIKSDPRKIGNFELLFNPSESGDYRLWDRIRFAELESDFIVSFNMRILNKHSEVYSWENPPNLGKSSSNALYEKAPNRKNQVVCCTL